MNCNADGPASPKTQFQDCEEYNKQNRENFKPKLKLPECLTTSTISENYFWPPSQKILAQPATFSRPI